MTALPVYRNVIVLSDLSGRAAQALPHACAIVAPEGTIHLVHIIDRPETPNPMYAHYEAGSATPEARAQRKNEVEAALLALARACPPPTGVVITRHVIEATVDDTSDQLCGMATRLNGDIVCMTSHGRRGLARMFLGSVAEAVIRSSPVPVLIVRVAKTDLTHES